MLAPGAHALAAAEHLVFVTAGADHDLSVDRQVLERRPHRLRGIALRALLVGPPEPARSGQGGALGRSGVALAEAVAVECRSLALPDRCCLRHPTLSNRSACLGTRISRSLGWRSLAAR